MERLCRVVVPLAVSGVLFAGCGGDEVSGETTVPIPEATPAAPGGPADAPGESADDPAGAPEVQEGAALDDGRHGAHITAINVQGRSITVDLVDFLTGDEARQAYAAEFPDEAGGPPNDYFSRSKDMAVLSLPVSPDVEVMVVWQGEGGSDGEQIAFEELPGYLAERIAQAEESPPFWLTVAAGTVTAIEEQYDP